MQRRTRACVSEKLLKTWNSVKYVTEPFLQDSVGLDFLSSRLLYNLLSQRIICRLLPKVYSYGFVGY